MQLSLEEIDEYFRLHRALMFFVNQRLKVIDGKVATPDVYMGLPAETRFQVHEALYGRIDLIDAFVDEDPFGFSDEELEIVRSWKHFVTDTFYVFRYMRDHAIFLTSTEPVAAYGVVALFSPFERVIGTNLPRMVKTTLLPFKGRIIYDGLLMGYRNTFGGEIKRRLSEDFKEAKARGEIITSLPPDADAKPSPSKRATAKKRSAAKSTDSTDQALDRIVTLIDEFCREHLDDEYAVLCRKLAGVLARKRPSPLGRGKPESWASGIVRVIGGANFLNDPSQPHSMKMSDIDKGFGVSEATGAAKATAIRKLVDIDMFEPEWILPSRMDDNPLIWLLEVNGLMMDIRDCPREAQVVAFEKGLIPYIPADRPHKS